MKVIYSPPFWGEGGWGGRELELNFKFDIFSLIYFCRLEILLHFYEQITREIRVANVFTKRSLYI